MSNGDEDLITFSFHALVTLDENYLPYGEACTDINAVLPDGHLARGFDCVTADGCGMATVSFEVQIPRKSLDLPSYMLNAKLLENNFDSSLEDDEIEDEPAIILPKVKRPIKVEEPPVIEGGELVEEDNPFDDLDLDGLDVFDDEPPIDEDEDDDEI